MKTLILISAISLGLMGVGCSKSNTAAGANGDNTNSGTNVNPPGLFDPGAPTGSGSGSTSGTTTTTGSATVPFVPASLSALQQYALPGSPYVAVNNPTNIQISLNLSQSESARYGGDITISYTDNGVYHSATLSAGLGHNYDMGKSAYDNGTLQANYNYFFTYENQLVYTGYFEDQFGVITIALTPDEPVGGGNDAEPLSVPYKGSVYFKNFRNTSGQFVQKNNPYRSCWFIYTGVFDCRSNVITTKCGLEPGPEVGYTLLGTFTNIDIKKAFNIN